MRAARLVPLGLALAVAAGCNPGFRPQYQVDDLRILGVSAEVTGTSAPTSADADLGDRVRLTALVANPRERRPLTITWLGCLPSGTDALPACLDRSLLSDPARLRTRPDVLVLGAGEGLLTLEVPVADVQGALDALVARALAEPAFACQLYVELPVVVIAEAPDRSEVALKRVRLTPQRAVAGTSLEGAYLPNQNPGVQSLQVDPTSAGSCLGGEVAAIRCPDPAGCEAQGLRCDAGGTCGVPLPGGRRVLCARPEVGSVGIFSQCAPDGARTPFYESLDWQWFATAGSFEDAGALGNATGADVEFTRPDGPFTLWTVVRDGRGGEGWIRRDVP
jgi:hypothetical protein